ncbi:GSCOCG00012219001-RA-CDS, partial [Cotesia congregata]
MIFGTAQKLSDFRNVQVSAIRVNDELVEFCNSVKYLGVLLDDNLNWSPQVAEICKKSMRTLAQLKMHSNVFDLPVRKKLVTTLIFPTFDYCAAAFTDISGQRNIRLQRKMCNRHPLQMNACVRFIFKISRFEHVMPYYRDLRWLSLKSRREFFLSCLIYKAFYLHQ